MVNIISTIYSRYRACIGPSGSVVSRHCFDSLYLRKIKAQGRQRRLVLVCHFVSVLSHTSTSIIVSMSVSVCAQHRQNVKHLGRPDGFSLSHSPFLAVFHSFPHQPIRIRTVSLHTLSFILLLFLCFSLVRCPHQAIRNKAGCVRRGSVATARLLCTLLHICSTTVHFHAVVPLSTRYPNDACHGAVLDLVIAA